MRSDNKKGLMVGVIIGLVLVVTLGVTFAVWNYSRVGDNQLLVTGDIYMKFKENNTLTIEDALPREEYIPDKYFEFTVEGVNDYSKDIHYQILLSEGEAPTGDENKDRTERIRPDLLLFKLVEVEDGEEKDIIFDRMSYPELNNTSVWVDTIKANTNTKTSKTYRLYMWVSPLTKIGVGENLDYVMDTWNNNVYGSVKVTVQGDFNEKEAFSCFEGAPMYNDQRTDEQVNACVEWFTKTLGPEEGNINEGESYKGFCDGTGTINGLSFDLMIYLGLFNRIPNGLQELSEIGIVKISPIVSYSEKCSKDVVIPRYINKVKVTEIFGSAFSDNQLTSVNIPNSVTTIYGGAFAGNKLTSINIPDSVTTIGGVICGNLECSTQDGAGAFEDNKLTNITIGQGINYIGLYAFRKENDNFHQSNIDLSSITINKTCEEIRNIEASPDNSTKYYPWLSITSLGGSNYGAPYTAPGVTIYGSNGEVCNRY